jgi:hypothetical protein
MFEDYIEQPIDEIVPAGVTHIGFIPGSHDGSFAIVKPKKYKWGTSATFSKERILPGERPSQTLRRCIQIYQVPSVKTISSIYSLGQVWSTTNSKSFFFTGLTYKSKVRWETEKSWFQWATPEQVFSQLERSQNELSKQRDMALFQKVQKECLCPHRRVLLMLSELHQRGFERLRAPAYDGGVAWRCPIVPAAWTFKHHGGLFCAPSTPYAPLDSLKSDGSKSWQYIYSAAYNQRPFDWDGVVFHSPRELAERFIREFPEIAFAGWGPDDEYVRWYKNLLEILQPYHLFAAFGDCWSPTDYIPGPDGRKIPLPPPGHTDESQIEEFKQRFS